MENMIYTVIQSHEKGKSPYYGTSICGFTDKDDAIAYAMEHIFGEDWEFQLEDDDWEEQGEVLEAYDLF